MHLAPGTRLGSYEIVGLLGEGGMGEVYRARDLQLHRDVAIKVLPALVADDAERLMRFEREARTLAALNHPHIAAIYGLEKFIYAGSKDPALHSDARRADGAPGLQPRGNSALVMELVEGPTLAERIAQGVVPWPEALRVARQIADALEAAHEKGIVHRDLKPANVKLTLDGDVKVLDFGLAKALDTDAPGAASGSAANSPTLTSHGTRMGMILGTAAYMSPEQARGKVVDRRADIWAFGCVLYEIITRRRAFEGEEITDVLARLIERDPDWSALPPDTSPEMRRLLARCLTKDPKARLRDIGEARVAIDEMIAGRAPAAALDTSMAQARAESRALARPAPALWQRLAPWALVTIFAGAAAWLFFKTPAEPAASRLVRVELALPADVEFFSGPSISADGTKFAFVGVRQGIRQIYTRAFEDAETRPAAGTETASVVCFSADGRTLVFVTADGWLKRLAMGTGIVEQLVRDVDLFTSPAVAADGSIAFSRGNRLVLRAPAGAERELATIDKAAGEVQLTWPVFAAGDTVVLFKSTRRDQGSSTNRLEAVPAAGGSRRVLIDGANQAVSASTDRIVFEQDGALFTAVFDPVGLAIRGTPARLGEKITVAQTGGVAASVANTGALLAAPPAVLSSHLVWVSASGVDRIIPGPPRGFQNPRVSPIGQLIAFSEAGKIWTFDPTRGTFTRVSGRNEPSVGFPAWSHDGTSLYYRSPEGIRLQRADGEGTPKVLPNTGISDYPAFVSPDGSRLIILRITPETAGDIYSTPAAGGELKPVLVTKSYEGGPQLSPDGKWLLYVSNDSGRMEVFVRSFGGVDRKWPVSNGGGLHPLWSRDGRQIFYRSGQQLLAVDVTTTPEVRLSAPRVLFDRRYEFGPNLTFPNYSLSKDGREFLMVQEEPGGRHLSLVLNWVQGLGRN